MQLTWNNPLPNDLRCTYSWGNSEVDYAADVHEGEVSFAGGSIARPWTDVAISRTNVAQIFHSEFSGDLRAAFTGTAIALGNEFRDVIDNYSWGISSANPKRYRNLPTWDTITDSGALRDSQQEVIE